MSKPKTDIDARTIRALLHYDPDTGVFTWRSRGLEWFSSETVCRGWNSRYAGQVAGSNNRRSRYSGPKYRQISVFKKIFFAHRLAFLWMTGSWPDEQVDHRDLNGLNNRWSNLRQANKWQNRANTAPPKKNTTGAKGVRFDPVRKKYKAEIRVRGRYIWLGRHTTITEAKKVYDAAAYEHFGQFANTGTAP